MERDICASVPEAYREHARELLEQLEFQKKTLQETREKLEGVPIVIPYDHGGGQKGLKKNPAFETYNALMRTYNATINELKTLLDEAGAATLPATSKLIEFKKYKRAQ